MKRINKKGFTLIELLAVIVVLAIILVITVPMVLNSLSSTRQDALNSSAASVVKTYKSQMGMILLGKKQEGFMVDLKSGSNGKINSQLERCITENEAKILGLNTTDYSINTSCTGTSSLSGACYNTENCSTVKWNSEGVVTVKLVGASGGKFMSGNTPLVATSSSSGNTNLAGSEPAKEVTLTNTTAGNEVQILKVYGPSLSTILITTSGKNLFKLDKTNSKANYHSSYTVLENGFRVVGVVNNTTNPNSYQNGYIDAYKLGNLPAGKYTLSYKEICNGEVPSSVPVNLYGLNSSNSKIFSGNKASTYNNNTKRYSIPFETTVEIHKFYGELKVFGMSCDITDLQLEIGEKATSYVPYQDPETYTISLDQVLRSSSDGSKKDYIDFETGKIVRWIKSDGSVLSTPDIKDITLPTVKTLNGTTIISSNANMEVSY